MSQQEIWRHVDGYDMYEISNLGRVRTKFQKDTDGNDRVLKGSKTTRGYIVVSLKKSKKADQEFFRLHRLVVENFIGPLSSDQHIDHIDEDKSNNALYNLRICTVHENNMFYKCSDNRISGSSAPVSVKVNGVVYKSIRDATAFIIANAGREVKFDTVRRELSPIANRQSVPRNMYGMFMIEPA